MENEWIDIEMRKPPNDAFVLITVFDLRPKVMMRHVRIAKRMNASWFDDHNEDKLNPKYGIITHWMPLPDPAIDDEV